MFLLPYSRGDVLNSFSSYSFIIFETRTHGTHSYEVPVNTVGSFRKFCVKLVLIGLPKGKIGKIVKKCIWPQNPQFWVFLSVVFTGMTGVTLHKPHGQMGGRAPMGARGRPTKSNFRLIFEHLRRLLRQFSADNSYENLEPMTSSFRKV